MRFCRCILCGADTGCGNPPVCELHDEENLTKEEAAKLNLFLGGCFYKAEEKDESSNPSCRKG